MRRDNNRCNKGEMLRRLRHGHDRVGAAGERRIVGLYHVARRPHGYPHQFCAPGAAVFVIDNAKGQISMCYPDNKDNKVQVICTPATKLP
jgi:hypothetical protein